MDGISDWLLGNHDLTTVGWTEWVTLFLILFFLFGTVHAIRIHIRARHTIRYQIDAPKPSLAQVLELAHRGRKEAPFILILVPARNESMVITNTIVQLMRLNYPAESYAIIVITDEREQKKDDSPTTKEIATALAAEKNSGFPHPRLYVIDVPEWYSGEFGSLEKKYSRSTKGRALNFALQFVRSHPRLSQADMLGVLDADGRMHPHTLLEVAFKRLRDNAEALQGPVFQISNYADVSLSGKAAGIELSIYHLSTLAYRLQNGRKRAEFLAGTNYFIGLHTIVDLGGWNEKALVEDAELGLRLFLKKQIKPGWLSCYEIEQTPPDHHVYLQQRQRWAMGHLQVLPIINKTALPLGSKIALHWRVLSAILKSPLDIGLPILGWLALFLGWTQGLPQWVTWVMALLLVASLFVWDFFGRGFHMLEKYMPVKHHNSWGQRRIAQLHFIVSTPWLMVLHAQPRLVACYKYLAGCRDFSWIKTKRTAEEPVSEILTLADGKTDERIPVFESRKVAARIDS